MRLFYSHIVLLFFIKPFLYAQVPLNNPQIKHTDESYAEKVYLQLDKIVYTSNETIWFKAIITGASNHAPTKLSNVVYVELVDPYEKIIDNRLLKVDKGIAEASFTLQNYQPGYYLIRAYTEWNKNFGQDFIFNQYIQIHTLQEKETPIKRIMLTKTTGKGAKLSAQLNPRLLDEKYRGKLKVYLNVGEKEDSLEIKKDKTGYYNLEYSIPEGTKQATLKLDLGYFKTFSKTVVLNSDDLDLQFFPEGGELVSGLKTVLGFKAIDYAGKGKEVSGHIIDEKGKVISVFKSNPLGMGKVIFTPEANIQYYGVIIGGSKEEVLRYPLPKVVSIGMVLNVTENKTHINVSVNSNGVPINESIYVQLRHSGITNYYSKIKTDGSAVYKQFEKALLPEGIIEFTIFNHNQDPICERLFFNRNKEQELNILVKSNRSIYGQRDKIKLNIDVTDFKDTPVNANTSVLVINKEQLGGMQALRQNIRSYFLLSSEIKGGIENIGYYFNDDNSVKDLDLLMLTQGWRKYNYKKTKKNSFKYRPEKGLTVSGKIEEVISSKKPLKQSVELTMVAFGEGSETGFYTKQVDSTGVFNFSLPDLYKDNLEVLIQTRNIKGKHKNYTINLDKKNIPGIHYNPQKKIEVVDTIVNKYLEKVKEDYKINDVFKLTENQIELDEVLLDGYKLTPERERIMELQGPPDVVIEGKDMESKIEKWTQGLYKMLLFNYPDDIDIIRVGTLGGFLIAQAYGADFTFIIVDGIPVSIENYPLIGDLPTEEIKSIELVKNPKNSSQYAFDTFGVYMKSPLEKWSFINIYTHADKGLFSVKKTMGMSKKTIPVFSTPREFYVPKYEGLISQDWQVPDLRSLLYWNANLQTDTGGKAAVEFYNTDAIGDMLIVIEAIIDDGKIGYHETTYTVEEKLEK